MPSHVPVSVRRSVLTPLDRAVRARAVERRLIDAIQLGLFADGEQLPSEATLAAQLGVATVTLREALVELRRRGLVETRRGRGGGSFVRAPAADDAERARERLLDYSVDELRDMTDHRVAIAAESSRLAADRASLGDLARLVRHLDAFDNAPDDAARRRSDVRLHVELAAIARSRRLTTAEMDIQAEISAFLWLTFSGSAAAAAAAEHRAIADTVRNRDADEAGRRASTHVAREMRDLISIRLASTPPAAGDAVPNVFDVVLAATDDVFSALARVRDEVLRVHDAASSAGHGLKRGDLDPLRALLRTELDRLSALAGLGMIFAPGALADEVRWLDWLYRSEAGPPEPLVTTLDPEAPDFYDYEAAEWYYEPRARRERWIAGPFVDHSGTNAHIFTLSQPVIHKTGAFLGVASGDLTVGAVETIAAPALAGVPGTAVLLNHRGRVIASNTAAWLPGTLYTPSEADTVLRDQRVPWTVVLATAEHKTDGN